VTTTPQPSHLVEVLRLIDTGRLPVPDRLSEVATYAIAEGCVELESMSLSERGQRVLAILGGGREGR
jgi:hypothetical protein